MIELLIAITAIVVVVSLLLAALGNSRSSAQAAVGASNLRSVNSLHAAYASENRGTFYNPFVTSSAAGQPAWTLPIDDGGDLNGRTYERFGYRDDNRFVGEGFMAYWHSYMALRNPGQGFSPQLAFAPGDEVMLNQWKERSASMSEGLFPGSYYYSPVFFKNADAYSFADWPGACPSSFGAAFRGNFCDGVPEGLSAAIGMQDLTQPASKVILWERADFRQVKRTERIAKVQVVRPLPPAWNNPAAKPQAATCDGAVARVDMAEATRRAAESLQGHTGLESVPVDLVKAPDELPVVPANGTAVVDGQADADGLYPMFFGATRGGVKGRDVPR
ncbi:MAG: hypothetical protein JSR77_08230 [Planctomycetes bacterium]|nr:hypothetical protein [Planctomycetota bacterium]